jgi:hypothetical protein
MPKDKDVESLPEERERERERDRERLIPNRVNE